MPTAADPPTLDSIRYRVVRPLGQGAGSSILLIRDEDVGRQFALKVVKRQDAGDDVFIQQAIHEAEVAATLNHRSILKVHDCRVKKSWFKVSGVELLMEYVDGKTLDEVGKVPLGPLVLIFGHVASALKHMHRRGVSHGDLKPSNLMVSRSGDVKVIDFGTAWVKGRPKDRVQGTPQYMAPEQAAEKVVDERTDLYNFGATLYRMLTGEYANLVLPGDNLGTLGAKYKPKSPLSFDPSVPGTLNELVMACLERNPDRRPAGFFEVRHQLAATATYLGVEGASGGD